MNLKDDLIFIQTNTPGNALIRNFINDIDFDEVVAGPQGSNLSPAAFFGSWADFAGIRPGQETIFFSFY